MRNRYTLLVLFAGLCACTGPASERPSKEAVGFALHDPLLLSGFGMAHGKDVGTPVSAEGQTLVPNLRFDMEGPLGDPHALRSDRFAHSGNWSFHFPEGAEYSPHIARRVSDVAINLSAIRVELWLRTAGADPRLNTVIKIKRYGQEQITWYGKELKASEHTPDTWERFNAELLIRDLDVRPDDSIFVDLWNREKNEVFVDDLAVSFISAAALQRTPTASTARARALPYAQVHCAASTGIAPVAGTSAPPAGPVEVPIATGSAAVWHYAPGDGVVLLIDRSTEQPDTIALVRPHCPTIGDLLHFDRLIARPEDNGLSLTAFDVDVVGGTEVIAAAPAPVQVTLTIDQPRR